MALSEKQKQAIFVSAFVRTKQGLPNPFKASPVPTPASAALDAERPEASGESGHAESGEEAE